MLQNTGGEKRGDELEQDLQQRGKLKTTKVSVSNNLRPNTSHAKPVKKDNLALESLNKLQAEIDESFKSLKHLPNQKLHPFDLEPEDLAELKECFPEFRKKKDARQTNKNTGIDLEELKRLLLDKI